MVFYGNFISLQAFYIYKPSYFTYYSYSFSYYNEYCGHSMGVIPGLVSIPVVKSFCVLFVYYGFLWEFHFAASSLHL